MAATASPPDGLTTTPVPYAGIASRAVALTLDVLIAQGIVLLGGAMLALVASLVGDAELDTLGKLLAAWAWMTVVVSYFVVFWTSTGQTPGMRALGLRVTTTDGGDVGLGRAAIRIVGLGLAIVPLFAGFLPVLVDDRRRALQDFMAGTIVVYDTRA
ncbi:MAG TPA: RDD family protein [Solirubrobacteraceae bacterium]|nr:RDD family protein [Solirubrobacteraceae bacterium]